MAKLLALDWDQQEARLVVARPKGDSITIEQAVAVPIRLSTQQGNHEELAEQLQAAFSRLSLPKCQVLTAIGRSMIELDRLQLPPAPEEELPDMVRFQAMRQFSSLQENSPLDFVPLGDAGNEPGEIIAAAIPRDLSEKVNKAITAQGQEPHRVVMRPCAVASLAIRRSPAMQEGVALIIAQQSESAELVVVKQGLVVFTRSFRLPPDWVPSESGEPMLGEVRRTIAAAQNQLGGSRIEKIGVFGKSEHHQTLSERIRERTELDVQLLSPFADVTIDNVPDRPERFAAAVGMLLDEVNGVVPVIDFLNPRKAPEPESPTRKRVFYGGLAATVVLGMTALVMWQYHSLNQELKRHTRVFAQLAQENKNLESTVRLAQELRDWKKADRNWLDELVHLSTIENLTADDYMLESISGRTLRDYRGEIDIQGKSKTLKAQHELQDGWDDEHHQVSPEISSPIKNKKDNRYPNMFRALIRTDVSIPIGVAVENLPANTTTEAASDPSNAESAKAEPEPVDSEPSQAEQEPVADDGEPLGEAEPAETSASEPVDVVDSQPDSSEPDSTQPAVQDVQEQGAE